MKKLKTCQVENVNTKNKTEEKNQTKRKFLEEIDKSIESFCELIIDCYISNLKL